MKTQTHHEKPYHDEPVMPPEYERHMHHRYQKEKRHAGRIFRRSMELLAIVLSFLARSRIARFLTAKASMDLVVEVTAVLGRDAGHRLSTFFAFLAAEPALIAVFVTAIVLLTELILWVIARLRPDRRRRRRR